MKLAKVLMVLLPAGAFASFAIPTFLHQQKCKALTKQFRTVLKHYNLFSFSPGGKEGKLEWPNTAASLDPSTLPTIPGGVFIMKRGERIERGNNWEDRPPVIHDSFFELDDHRGAVLPVVGRTCDGGVRSRGSGHRSRRERVTRQRAEC